VARNRKRARDRRPSRPGDTSGLATANGSSGLEAPEPLAHATPDSELAEAQLSVGRPELADAANEQELEAAEESSRPAPGAPGGAVVAHQPAHPEVRESIGARLANFLRGSWRELQRVQWPDRRQTMQATGVVIGFVIVAGVFLGVADLVAQKLVNFILK
jgi:preprotein translocase subunit SecE